MEENKKHVQIPQANTIDKSSDLKLLDYLVYANIKRFVDKETLIAKVSTETLARKCNMSQRSILKSIEKLENANMFKVIRSANAQKKNCNQYQFQQLKEFEMFSDEFLDASEFTNKVKAYWIMLQSEAYKDTTNSLAYISKNDKELSESLNLDLRTVQKYNKELENLGIMNKVNYGFDEAGFSKQQWVANLVTLNQYILCSMALVNEQVTENKECIDDIYDKIAKMEAKHDASEKIMQRIIADSNKKDEYIEALLEENKRLKTAKKFEVPFGVGVSE